MSRLQTVIGDLSVALDKDSLRPTEISALLKILSTAEGDDLEACAQLVGDMSILGRLPGTANSLLMLGLGSGEEVEEVSEEPPPPEPPPATPEENVPTPTEAATEGASE